MPFKSNIIMEYNLIQFDFLKFIKTLYRSRVRKSAANNSADPQHPEHKLVQTVTLRWCYRNSFYPQAFSLNKHLTVREPGFIPCMFAHILLQKYCVCTYLQKGKLFILPFFLYLYSLFLYCEVKITTETPCLCVQTQ